MGIGGLFLIIYFTMTLYTIYVVKNEEVCRIYRKFVLILTKIRNEVGKWWRQIVK